ncbi:unnamed protein product [Onchocerca flexuosa]|uniref:Sm domain-containing protein n=2 Tax=Onchocerca flexuosa TaxID=387005 RepID=A0A183H8R0_9BILA|nr:unnamed protein product [Onchocerca flexuosa]
MMLIRLLMKLRNEQVKIELKNGALVEGTVNSVDVTMNFYLSSVSVKLNNQKDPVPVDAVSVRGNSIRCIIFRDNLNLDKLMIDNPPQRKKTKAPDQVRSQDVTACSGSGRNSGRGGPRSQYFAKGAGRGGAKS